MHELFGRGVTEDGRLRPGRDEAPALYKQAAIGWTPKDWEVTTLRRCLVDAPTNGIYKPAKLIGRGTLVVGQTAVTPERSINFNLARRAVVFEEELSRYGLAESDILISRVFATVAGVGLPALVPGLSEPAVYESNMMRLRVDRSTIQPRLLFEWLRSDTARRWIAAGANSSNQSSINQQVLNDLPVVRPTPREQERLVALIEASDRSTASELSYLAKLRHMGHGLKDHLLTGRVRVSV